MPSGARHRVTVRSYEDARGDGGPVTVVESWSRGVWRRCDSRQQRVRGGHRLARSHGVALRHVGASRHPARGLLVVVAAAARGHCTPDGAPWCRSGVSPPAWGAMPGSGCAVAPGRRPSAPGARGRGWFDPAPAPPASSAQPRPCRRLRCTPDGDEPVKPWPPPVPRTTGWTAAQSGGVALPKVRAGPPGSAIPTGLPSDQMGRPSLRRVVAAGSQTLAT